MCFGTSCASGVIGVVGSRKGAIDEHSADEEAAEKHFHVPATSSEALSAIQRRCQGMEALFSDFHVGDVGVGVVGGWSGRRFGHLVVSGTCGAGEVGVLLPELKNQKNAL